MPLVAKTFETALRTLAAILLVALAAVAAQAEPVARAYPEGDRLFRSDPRWLGGDAAISVPLSGGRTLWLFGDSFVDETEPYTRAGAAFVRNTVAIQTGADPRKAQMRFYWRRAKDGSPAAFFPNRKDIWYWPRSGIRLGGGSLIVFLHKIKATNDGLKFASAGYAIAQVTNPDSEPSQWQMRVVEQRDLPFDALPGGDAVIDGEQVVVLATREKRAPHAGALVRYPAAPFFNRDLSKSEWWLGEKKGWVAVSGVGRRGPPFVMDDAGAESSLHWDARLNAYVHVASYGFGATTIGVRTAPKLTGPWSAARTVYRPPESDAPRPFVYAGKAHPELIGPDGSLLVTYVANSFDHKKLLSAEGERTLYWPRFVAIPVEDLQP